MHEEPREVQARTKGLSDSTPLAQQQHEQLEDEASNEERNIFKGEACRSSRGSQR